MYKSAFQNYSSALIILDENLTIIDINAKALAIKGLSNGIIREPFLQLFQIDGVKDHNDLRLCDQQPVVCKFVPGNNLLSKEQASTNESNLNDKVPAIDLKLYITPAEDCFIVKIESIENENEALISLVEDVLNLPGNAVEAALKLNVYPISIIDMDNKTYLFQNAAHKEMVNNLIDIHSLEKIPYLVDKNLFLSEVTAASSSVFVPYVEEHQYTDKSGLKRYYELHGTPVLLPPDNKHILILQYNELTQGVILKNELEGYKKFLQEIFASLPGMVFKCLNENNWTIEYVSPTCKDITGYSYTDLVNNNKIRYGDLIHDDDKAKVWQKVQDAVKKRRSYSLKYRIITRRGAVKWVHENGRANYDEYGNVVNIEGFITDVSESEITQQKLKFELQVSEAIARMGLNLLKDYVSPIEIAAEIQECIVNLTGSRFTLIYAPDESDDDFTLFMNSSPQEVFTVRMKDFNDNQKQFLKKLVSLTEPFVNNNSDEVCFPGYSEEKIKVSRLMCIPAFTNKKLTGILIAGDSNSDYTDDSIETGQRFINMFALGMYRLRAEEKLQEAKSKAEESDRLKSLFLSNMSHEIRTPMNAIVGFAEMLQDSDLSIEQKNRFLEVIIKSGDNLLRLINDIIDISKIEAGQLKFDYTDCLVNEMISDLETFFKRELIRLKKRNLNLYVRLGHPESDFALQTDSTRLKQILNNLIGNAIKFTDEGFIEFGYEIKTGVIEFFVRDSGIGIAQEKQELIFERFGQVQEAISRNLAGTGLGLTISKNLVELMGGNIWVDSIVGEGSTFFFTLPLRISRKVVHDVPAAEPITKQPSNLSGKNFLIVEDVDTNYFYLSSLLQKFSANVLRATNGQKAVDMVKSDSSIDLVLMDIELPILDGYQATRLIKEIRPELPVIAQTAFAMMGEREKSREAGCNDYLSKPIRKEELLSVLKKFFS